MKKVGKQSETGNLNEQDLTFLKENVNTVVCGDCLELIIYAVKGKFDVNNKRDFDKRNYFYSDVWRVKRDMGKEDNIDSHETVKQINVVKLPIEHASVEGDVVFDPFLGSGTTAVACKQLNRNFLGFEISEEYCKIARKRLEQSNINEWFE